MSPPAGYYLTFRARACHVRFALNSRSPAISQQTTFRAIKRLMHRSKQHLFDSSTSQTKSVVEIAQNRDRLGAVLQNQITTRSTKEREQ
jgi:hypothetical protein